jgi:cyclopropane-fatty-acyl-phospholipid synthase
MALTVPHHKHSMWARAFIAVFDRADLGTIRLTFPDGDTVLCEGKSAGVSADLQIHDWKVIRAVFLRGDIGFGEAYVDGLWSTEDLGVLMTYLVQNLDSIEDVSHGSWWMRRLFMMLHWVRDNSRMGSRRNIRAHYDVGNPFYQLWLDDSMTYSSALYEQHPERTLEEAQVAKYQRLISKMSMPANILEIGCGWGGFAEEAAKSGYSVTGLTLSREQLAYASTRMQKAGLDDKVQLHFEDYRDVKGRYDYIVSIEMFEAVGERYWPVYFRTIKERLKQGGKALIQTITIDDRFFEAYRTRSDFIRHYTFPGGMLPSVARLTQEIDAAGLKCQEIFSFGQDYAKTCQQWLARIDEQLQPIKALGYSDAFVRSWRFYLGCCIGAFAAERTNVVQLEIIHA